MRRRLPHRRVRHGVAIAALLCGGCASGASRATYDEQIYFPASHNWAFRRAYPAVDHLFNAFDYGHAIVYERLVERRPADVIEGHDFDWITQHLLRHPPSVPLDEAAVGPEYVRLAPELHATFEWAHMLHRQIYDIWADDRIAPDRKDAAVAEVLRYYRSRHDLALSSVPKAMALMESGPHALTFRRTHPKYTGLLWSYHWLQMAAYDALMLGATPAERGANVRAVTTHFFAMLADAPRTTPSEMPMAAAVAPRFARRYPEAAIVFDNLHSLHDVAADILAAPGLSDDERHRLLLAAGAAYRDDVTQTTTLAEWRDMATMMDAARMGGTAEAVLAAPGSTPPASRP
jgi:hypothetical protein